MLKKIYEFIKKNPMRIFTVFILLSSFVAVAVTSAILTSQNYEIRELENQNNQLRNAINEASERVRTTQGISAELNVGVGNLTNKLYENIESAKQINSDLQEIITKSQKLTDSYVNDFGHFCFSTVGSVDMANDEIIPK